MISHEEYEKLKQLAVQYPYSLNEIKNIYILTEHIFNNKRFEKLIEIIEWSLKMNLSLFETYQLIVEIEWLTN